MGDTRIAWTNKTLNPTRGCSLVSPGCTNCYAMKQAHRFSGPGQPYEGLTKMTSHGPVWTGKLRMVPEMLDLPRRVKKPATWFVDSMSDLFHEDVPDEFICRTFEMMLSEQRHTFQILTKRPERMREFCVDIGMKLPNVWLGVSVEDQQRADERIPLLLQTPAAVRFLSCEPLLGPVDLTNVSPPTIIGKSYAGFDCLSRQNRSLRGAVDWVIVGGESGPKARPFHLSWARSLVAQCKSAGVACFVKQVGADPYTDEFDDFGDYALANNGAVRLRNRAGADPLEWPVDLRVQEFPA